MLANVTALTINPMFLRHDLLIELGRLEIAIRHVDHQGPANDQGDLTDLQTRRTTINQALSRLSA